jgi:hypothetical protein
MEEGDRINRREAAKNQVLQKHNTRPGMTDFLESLYQTRKFNKWKGWAESERKGIKHSI